MRETNEGKIKFLFFWITLTIKNVDKIIRKMYSIITTYGH